MYNRSYWYSCFLLLYAYQTARKMAGKRKRGKGHYSKSCIGRSFKSSKPGTVRSAPLVIVQVAIQFVVTYSNHQ